MMYCKILFVLLVVSGYSHAQRDKKFFRSDYHYIKHIRGFYKIHTLHKTWFEAKRVCALEGASLFFPENTDEAQAVVAFWRETQPKFTWMHLGISSLVAKGVFVTIDGRPISDVYHEWGQGEPNNGQGAFEEDCTDIRPDATINDIECSSKGPFICKKSLVSLEWNRQCKMPNMDYEFNEEFGRCYKFHVKPMDWTEAYSVCNAEQSYLAVVNDQKEADYLVKLTAKADKDRVTGNFTRGVVHLGFHNKHDEGWQVIRGGVTLDASGYAVWASGQPDGGDRERCGSMTFSGELNDIACDRKSFFICEHEIDSRSNLT